MLLFKIIELSSYALMIEIQEYKIVRILGEGSHSVVFEAFHKTTGAKVALKLIQRRRSLRKSKSQADHEIEAFNHIKSSRHPKHRNIIDFYGCCEVKGATLLTLEYFPGLTLQKAIFENYNRPNDAILTNKKIKSCLHKLIDCLKYLHSLNIYHCDLKPENIMVADNDLRIVDFGSAIITDHPVKATRLMFWGTPGYLPPETLNYTSMVKLENVDIWAFVCIVYCIFKNFPPFRGADDYLTFQKVRNLDYDNSGLPEWASELINSVFVENPNKRLNLNDIGIKIDNLCEYDLSLI